MINMNSIDTENGQYWDSELLDLSPHSNNEIPQRTDSENVVLREGERYVNERYNLSIEVLAENEEYVDVLIQRL